MTLEEFKHTLDEWGRNKEPFFFLLDFEMKKPVAFRLKDVDPEQFKFDFNGRANTTSEKSGEGSELKVFPPSQQEFKTKFDHVMKRLAYGDSYLTNLTIRSKIISDISLEQIFHKSRARYRVLYKNEFVVFSPEIFVQIKGDRIFSFPMKGTIDASLPDAHRTIMEDQKELAEHVTIVDLIRNDLSLVSEKVKVNRFRYAETINTRGKQLIQVSSEIEGQLFDELKGRFGTILEKLLPAGSISGAPKEKTVSIIRDAEGESRGYYTGIAGIFDGDFFDSGVLIRFIENDNGNLYYRSGGGLTTQSELEKEYQEAIDKIYVPLD